MVHKQRTKATSLVVLASALTTAIAAGLSANPAHASEQQRRIAAARKLQQSSVVVRSGDSQGTGFVVGRQRWVVTNAHVVRSCRCRRVVVRTPEGCRLRARVVAFQPERDLAVIETRKRLDLPPLPLGDAGELRIGQTVLAYGHPFGLVGTLTEGIVSARRTWQGVEGMIQTDASINPGNSGGPLADLSGRVVGVSSSIMPGNANHGIGFAVPVGHVRELLDRLRDERRKQARSRDPSKCRSR